MVRQNSLVKVRWPFTFTLIFSHPQKTRQCRSWIFLPPGLFSPHALLFAEPACATGLLREGMLESLHLCCHKMNSDPVLASSSVLLIFCLFVLLLKPYEKPPEKGECRTVHVKCIHSQTDEETWWAQLFCFMAGVTNLFKPKSYFIGIESYRGQPFCAFQTWLRGRNWDQSVNPELLVLA